MDAAREHHRQLGGVAAEGRQPSDQRLPQRERGERAAESAALAALEHELPRALVQEAVQKLGRRDVEVRADPRLLQRLRLRRASPGQERVRGRGRADRGELRGADVRGREPGGRGRGDADAPRQPAEPVGRLAQQLGDLVAVHQGERQERQAALLGDRARERGTVADVRHRPLHDRVGGAAGALARSERLHPDGGPQVRADLVADRLDHSPGGLVPGRERRGGRAVLPDRQRPPLDDHGAVGVRHPPRHRRRDLGGRVGLPDERELHVEHHAGRAARHRRRGRVRPDAARRVHGDVHGRVGQQPLEQHERGQVTGASGTFGAPRDEPHVVGEPTGHGDDGGGLVRIHDLDEQAASPREPGDVEGVVGPQRRGVHQDGVGRGGELGGPDAAARRDADPEGARPPAAHVREGGVPGREVGAEVEHPRPARARDGHGEMGGGTAERGDPDDLDPGAALRPSSVLARVRRHAQPPDVPSGPGLAARTARPDPHGPDGSHQRSVTLRSVTVRSPRRHTRVRSDGDTAKDFGTSLDVPQTPARAPAGQGLRVRRGW